MHWEIIAAVIGGIVTAYGLVAWPRPALICTGLLSLMLGLLSLASLKTISFPALIAVFAGIGLIGFGALIGLVEALLTETRRSLGNAPRSATAEYRGSVRAPDDPGALYGGGRVEPRLWTEPGLVNADPFRVSPAGSG